MKKLYLVILATLLTCSYGFATQTDKQKQSSATASSSASANSQSQASAGSGAVTLDSGTQIDAELTSSLDLKKAKPGDQVKMKTTKPVKNNGKEIISRGSTITGHVQQATSADKTTQATLVFDQLQDKKTHLTSSLSAVVTAIAKPANDMNAMAQEDAMTSANATAGPQPRTQQRSSQQGGGGLLGGVTQTVGGVTQGVTQTAGGVAPVVGGATGQVSSTVSSTTNATVGSGAGANGVVGGLARGTIQIVNNTTSSAASGSTLTMASRNARLESGTQFMLQTTSALTLTREPRQQ